MVSTHPHVDLHHAHTDIFAATSVADLHATLAHLHHQEATVTQRLNDLVASQTDLSRELGRLDLLRAHLGTQANTTRAISNGMLSDAASTAKRISTAVKRLDREQSNVRATLQVVEQVAELKACVLGVHGSMGAPQDWETAAGHLSRASKIPQDVVDGSFAEEIVPTTEIPDPPRVTLDQAAESLCGLFLREFEKAASEGDGSRVTRFFKLFPLIGRTDTGLDAYGRYVCQGVASRARTNFNSAAPAQRKEGFFYAQTITKLFEHIAQIVDGHEPLVERHYGPGMMAKVIERLQMEADVQGGIVLDTWHEERGIDRKLTDIKSYAFSFLVQSFMQKPAAGAPRSNSPSNAPTRSSEDEGVNMKEVDGLLGESALMLGRWALYSRFISDKCAPRESPDPPGIDHGLTMPPFLSTSNLHKKVSSHLVEPFNEMTTFFFRRSVEKAFQLDESPSDLNLNPSKPLGGNPPFITSAVDDVMYIVNQILQRSLATSQRAVVGSVVPTIARVLGGDFIGMIQRKMRDECYPKPVIQGALPPEDKVIAFLVLINNLDKANDYIKQILETQLGGQEPGGSRLKHLFPFGHDATFVEDKLKALEQSFTSKAGELLNDGIQVTFHNVLKPRVRPIFAEAFRDVDYAPSGEEDDADDDDLDDDVDLVKSRFDRGWGAVIRPIKRILTPANYDRLLTVAMTSLASALEKRIKGYYGRVNELGAVRLERDVAGIVNAAVGGGRYGLRDAFTKCTQMTLIMNMDDDEWDDVVNEEGGDSGIPWVMDAEERNRRRVLAQCPLYQHYSAERHEPYSTGTWNLSYARPIPSCRTFYSQEVEDTIERLRHVIVDPDLMRIFENSWPSTLDTTIAWRGFANSNYTTAPDEDLAFVITGDIEAISNSLAALFRGAINLQARYIMDAPFCNAFQAPDEAGIIRKSSANSDTITPYFDFYKVFSCQWELDSVASFLQLSSDYLTATQDYDFFARHNWTAAVDTILTTARSMTINSYSEDGVWLHTPYTYCAPYGGTPINDCNGSPHRGNIGLIRSYHRPSDDACTYQYLIPSNMMFSAALNATVPIMSYIEGKNLNLTKQMRAMSRGIRKGIEAHGIVRDPVHGDIYAYEVDGYGSANVMDDPNIPSLLSAPFINYLPRDSPVYANTRRKILSKDNPYYSWGPVITGVGSPHTLPGRAWPMASIMGILTSDNDAEIVRFLSDLVGSTDGLGVMHESVSSHQPGIWSRQWFSWANGLFGQAILDLEKRKPHILKMGFQHKLPKHKRPDNDPF
ncbi:glycoside hydrolase family 125 protein [Aaosphaeria arxii CBS 175.79]|uniref:Conserved oligomeric Golgi complex subunit 4 n=1 Tax=Aaosphaeria arxii CBS 175.79 TaxID=1450172 RepID=A0A6A5XFX8_9PLEO|nr:glycoside hydrolase family 125 protein [Aaosphaeria arxii CBS 175.79]KAF2011840.1 glycoside hydrolase family 125 protein [Aaosphaeria arxii CBS 175.79]